MQIPNSSSGRGIVQWVVPPSIKSKRDNSPRSSGRSPQDISSEHRNFKDNLSNPDTNDHIDGAHCTVIIRDHDVVQSNQPFIDLSGCRTICTFVEGHLKELYEHQTLINRARSKAMANVKITSPSIVDGVFITRNDTSKLKVRDEQTRAIESIKQLTNYLRELTHLLKQCELDGNIVDDDVYNKLSDARTEIIQALNDFVLANSDIDLPIIDTEDNIDYDLCIDAQRFSPKDYSKIKKISNKNSENDGEQDKIKSLPQIIHSTNSEEDNQQTKSGEEEQQQLVMDSESQIIGLEKRRREIQKLEKDTDELRKLFSDFYNLVKTQGEEVDTIENNIVIATQRVSEGQHNLNKTMKSLTVLVPFTGCMAGALVGGPLGIAIGGKLGGITMGCAISLLGLLSSYSAQRCISTHKIRND